MGEVEARRYRITGVLGTGGFGKVYRARMEGGGGFSKEVAIKLMRDAEVPEMDLKRLRDEARIMGLVRDRAIVWVDPPTRLAGRWAVVMEYVDGTSVSRLLRLGPIPSSVVVEIIGEVARVLDKVYQSEGPDGRPIKLLHRDLKPANIQISHDGQVKILDFGMAKAQFANREAHTRAFIGGTVGYMAPERLEGQDGPEGDVFSLGVTAHVMLTGERPSRRQMMGLEGSNTDQADIVTQALVALSEQMRDPRPEERPSAREVEEACERLRRKTDGMSLRRWAEIHVPNAVRVKQDDMVGSVLSETLASMSRSNVEGLEPPSVGRVARIGPTDEPEPEPPPRTSWLRVAAWGLLAALVLGSLGTAVAAGLFGGVGLAVFATSSTEDVGSEEPRSEVVTSSVPDEPAMQALEAPAPPAAVEPPAAAAALPPLPAPDAPAEDDADEEDEKKSKLPSFDVSFTSTPAGAEVWVDGEQVGVTPLSTSLLNGRHAIELKAGGASLARKIRVGKGRPTRYDWAGGADWEAGD